MLLLGYGDGLYTSELDLWKAEGVSAEETDLFTVPELPDVAAQVDGEEQLFFDIEEAARGMSRESRMVVWRLASGGRKYELLAILEGR